MHPASEELQDVQEPSEATAPSTAADEAADVDEVASEEMVEPTVEEQLAMAEAQAAEYLDGWQRARAEFANARKRLERQRMDAYQNAAVDYAGQLLPILDDFDRALEAVPDEIAENAWFAGIGLVRRKLQGILAGLRVEPIEAEGLPFDPNFHEALSLVEVDGVENGIVIEELQTGYRLGERVIRPSLVNVAA